MIHSTLYDSSTLYFPQDAREHLYRTGQVSYADREFKFV